MGSQGSRRIANATLVGASALAVLMATVGLARSGTTQRIAVPAYFDARTAWAAVDNSYPTLGRAVINPINGPGKAKSVALARQVIKSQATGIAMLGYVHTDYGDRHQGAVKSDIDKYHVWYDVDGIFFDEVSTDCARAHAYYLDLYTYTRRKPGGRVVVLNPGTETRECFMGVSSTLVTFEGSYGDYVRNYSAPNWANKYSTDRFWHLVHGTSDIEGMEEAVRLSKQRRAGWIYVTPQRLPNPWNILPPSAYWSRELQVVRSG